MSRPVRVTCMGCQQTLKTLSTINIHARECRSSYSCAHGEGQTQPLVNIEALLQHLAASHHHKGLTRSTRPPAKAIAGPTTKDGAEVQWSKLRVYQWPREMHRLEAKVYTETALKAYGYSTKKGRRNADFEFSPSEGSKRLRFAVALDCEMVETIGNRNELVRLTAIDYLTREVLIDSLVEPADRVLDWRTALTGIDARTMTNAPSDTPVLHGWKQARQELFKYIDSSTILVGQALNNDLKALRLQHSRIVDSLICTSEAVQRGNKRFSLHSLCQDLLHRPIRTTADGTHDSMEDAFAAREIVLRCVCDDNSLRKWAERQRTIIDTRPKVTDRRRRTRYGGTNKHAHETMCNSSYDDLDRAHGGDDSDEVILWEDIAEDLGWPHPDTGYDPWSD